MSFGLPWGSPFYSGGGSSSLVPSLRHVAIAGRAYMLDTKGGGGGWVGGDIPVQRAQADTSADPSEATLNTEGLWRRTRQSWHEGSGQQWADRPESRPFRYASSTGIYPWDKYALTLLPGTDRTLTSAETGLYLAVAAGRLYVTDGQVVRYTTNGTSWTAITGNPAATALSIASDGSTVYVAYGASGVYSIAPGAGAMTSYATGTASAVGYAKGRLIVLEGATATPRVYNVTATGAITAGTLLLTVPNLTVTPGQWTAEAPSALYIVGVVGDKTRLWRTAVKSDGTALDAPVIAGELPDGQLARSVQGYLGELVLVGTDDNVWVLTPDGNGNLARRGRVETAEPVYGFEPQDRFVWYGGFADATLGRLYLHSNVAEDPSTDFAPGAASDLAASLSGDVRSVATLGALRVFTVAGRGVYVQDTDKVASGTIDLGSIGFGIGDLKNVLYADIRFEPLASGDSVTVEVAKDAGPWVTAATLTEVGSVSGTADLGQLLAESVRLRLVLAGDPTVTMVTVRAAPAPVIGEIMRLRLLFFHHYTDLAGTTQTLDVPAERDYLRNLRAARTAVTIQLGTETFTGIVERLVEFTPDTEARDDGNAGWLGYWSGTQELEIKRVDA